MDLRTSLVFLGFASIGAVYFVLYRVVFFSHFKLKMIHSIYLPLLVTLFSLFVFNSARNLDGFAAIAGALALVLLNLPVVVYFILLIIYLVLDGRKKKQRTL
jgi:ABC-type phosphate transport system permease subunit